MPKIDIKNGVFRRRRGQTSDAGLDDRQLLAALFDGRFHAHARKMAEDLAKQAWFVRVQTVESTTEPTAIDFAVGKPTKWTIESIPDGLYLKGEQQTWNGTNKFMVVCMPKGSIALYAIFDAGMNADDAMRFHTIVSRNPTLYPLKV